VQQDGHRCGPCGLHSAGSNIHTHDFIPTSVALNNYFNNNVPLHHITVAVLV
jgi:hypothetical protein